MARMDGYEFIRRVRAEARYDDLPIIIVSTESEQRDRMKGFEAGANLYLVKPSDPAVMIDNIRIILASVAQPR
jgi:two-component system chemotaxis response regulator CheY